MTTPTTRTRQLYRVWDAAGTLLYLGKSVDPLRRLAQHRRDYENGTGAPWWPAFAAGGSWSQDPVIYQDEKSVLAAEAAAINAEGPLYNDKHNHGNPHRIIASPHGVKVQRGERRPAPVRKSLRPRRRWSRRRKRHTFYASAWLVLAVAIWIVIGTRVSALHGMEMGAITSAVVVGGARSTTKR